MKGSNMIDSFEEKRQFKRVYYSMEDAAMSVLSPAEKHASILFPAQLVNLSEGGVGFSMERPSVSVPAQGQRLLIRDLKGNQALTFLSGTTMEVRWLFDSAAVKYIGFGCQFVDLPAADALKIRSIVASAYAKEQ